MDILFIASIINPFSPNQGAEQRSCLLLDACTRLGNVDVISFCGVDIEDSRGTNVLYSKYIPDNSYEIRGKREKMKRLIGSFLPAHIIPVNREKKKVIDYYLGQKHYDYIVIRYALSAIHCGLLSYRDRLIVDIDDNTAEKIRIQGKNEKGLKTELFYRVYASNVARSMVWFENNVRRTFYSNKADCRTGHSIFLPNIPFHDFHSKIDCESVPGRILFVGYLRYGPNIDAMKMFLDRVYPKIVTEKPEVSLHIVGSCPDYLKDKFSSYTSVQVLGFVPSLENEYAEASVVILPMLDGAGTCIKFLEAIKMGRAIVTTESGFRGYDAIFKSGEDCYVAKNDCEFANNVLTLLNDDGLRVTMAESALKKYNDYYSKERFNKIIQEALCCGK